VKSGKVLGSDGVPGKIWVRALDFLGERLRHVHNECLRQGAFPQQWKQTKLVLLPKEGKEAGTPSTYRPICLLDEVDKIFERIIASRLVQHLSRVRDLHEEQYGFHEGRSTVDVIERVRSFMEAAVTEGRVAMAVSLDIANSFNTLPWDRVGDALREHETPPTSWRSFDNTSGTGVWSSQNKADSRVDGISGVGFRRGRCSAPYCGTSHLTGFFAFLSPVVATLSAMQMIR